MTLGDAPAVYTAAAPPTISEISCVIAACRAYPGLSNAKRVTFEYVMLKDVNDSLADAKALVRVGVPEPERAALQENAERAELDLDVLVEVHATSVNPVDTKVRQRAGAREFPIVLGYDLSGVVVRCGARRTTSSNL